VVLAATAGLRAFLPVFSASLMAWMTDLPLPDNLAWLERPQTVVIFGMATLLEIPGDKIPVVDHALDSIQVLTKPVLAVLAAKRLGLTQSQQSQRSFLVPFPPGSPSEDGVVVSGGMARRSTRHEPA
jgi:hypothetical protein